MELVFKIPHFEGPLDLLLYLVRKKRLDVREIPIAQLADEFVEYIEKMEKMDIRVTSDFIEMASTLMELKSKSLLPGLSKEEREEFEKKKEELMRRVEEYMKVKEILETLRKKERLFERTPVRMTLSFVRSFKKRERFLKILKSVLDTLETQEAVYRIKTEEISVEDMMERILEEMDEEEEIYDVLVRSKTKYELLVRFLALLELLKLGKIYLDGEKIRRLSS
ncbi:MAG TPA: segregation/condensation protein A [Thermotoga sp.]|nr:MAG: segregation/condensation protein A [Thermotogota bacterium]HDG61640.1 segregation/condensation protein A [Thermotoga sp.]